MGQLPAPKVNSDIPFVNCGVKDADPVLSCKSSTRKHYMTKAYLGMKEVHIELVADLITKTQTSDIKFIRPYICAHPEWRKI